MAVDPPSGTAATRKNLPHLDAALAAVDLVVGPAVCIGHHADRWVKKEGKRSGQPCLFVKGAGLSSFGRRLGAA